MPIIETRLSAGRVKRQYRIAPPTNEHDAGVWCDYDEFAEEVKGTRDAFLGSLGHHFHG